FRIPIPHQVLWRFGIVWEDTTIRELLVSLRSHGFNRNSKLRFLDVGCFEGELLDRLRVETSWTVFGLEPNTKAVEVAHRKGVEVWQGAAEEAARIIPNEYLFDVIFMGQSIEHVNRPIGVIRQLRLLLAPGGIIVLSTPNLDSKQVQLFGPTSSIWHPPYHRYIFSRRSLAQLAARSGMRMAGVKSFSHPYWTAMSIQQNRFGLGGFVSHAVEFEPHICHAAQDVVFWSKLLWDWHGGGDYLYAVLAQ
ncbi:MAG: class I SAM-dependent methyltransferase, partial [Nitrososphaera sp.]